MKNSRLLLVTKVSISGFIISMLLFTFSACVKKEAFITSQVVPAARGFVKINRDNNINIKLINDKKLIDSIKNITTKEEIFKLNTKYKIKKKDLKL